MPTTHGLVDLSVGRDTGRGDVRVWLGGKGPRPKLGNGAAPTLKSSRMSFFSPLKVLSKMYLSGTR